MTETRIVLTKQISPGLGQFVGPSAGTGGVLLREVAPFHGKRFFHVFLDSDNNPRGISEDEFREV